MAGSLQMQRHCRMKRGFFGRRVWGDLAVYDTSIEFINDDFETVLSAPLLDFHSPYNWINRGMVIYHGRDRLLFDFRFKNKDQMQPRGEYGGGNVIVGEVEPAVRTWVGTLALNVARSAPPDLRVRRPLGPRLRWLWGLGWLLLASLLVAVFISALFLGLTLTKAK